MIEITPQVIAYFRAYFPAFADVTKYPDNLVEMLLEEAAQETGSRWGGYDALLRRRGMFNYVAHKLTLRDMQTAAGVGGGVSPDLVSSKSVGSESVSYAVATPSVADRVKYGDWLLTAYGIEFLRLRSRIRGPIIV